MANLNESELDRLEMLLEDEAFQGEAMLLDEVQALFCALASGPEDVPESIWLPVVLADHELPADGAELVGLLQRFRQQIGNELATGAGVAPMLYPVEEDSEVLDFAAWADSYLYGTELTEPAWHEAAGQHAEDLGELLQPLFLLSGALKAEAEEHGQAWLSPGEESSAMAEAQENLCETLLEIYRFWRILTQPVATVRRDSPKLGRNDPCSCGSGKKFKQCCGR